MAQGKDEIIKKIKKDAEKVSLSTLDEANASAKEIIELAYNDAKIFKQNYMEKSFAKRDEIINRKKTVAELEVKKIILKKKQDIMQKAYLLALDKLKEDKEQYIKLVKAMLKKASDGDTIVISKDDKSLITKEFFADFCKENKVRLMLAPHYGDFSGGIIIEGKKADMDLSLEEEIQLVREQTEPEVAKMIFGASNG